MEDFQLQQGETLRLKVYVEEEGADTAEFVATDGTTDILTVTASFNGFVADLSTNDTVKPPGVYDWYIRVTWDDGSSDIIPDDADCDGECDLPTMTICEIPGVS